MADSNRTKKRRPKDTGVGTLSGKWTSTTKQLDGGLGELSRIFGWDSFPNAHSAN